MPVFPNGVTLRGLFFFGRTGFDERRYDDFDESAARGIERDSDEKPRDRRQNGGEKRQRDKSRCGKNVRAYNTDPIAYFIHELARKQIDEQLYAETNGREQRYF